MRFFGRKAILTLVLWGGLALILITPCWAQGAATTVELTNPLGTQDVDTTFLLTKTGDVIKYVMGILGAIALAMFIYGGFMWLTSRGASDKIEKGKKIFVWSVIGLAVIFGSYLLVNLVIGGLTKAPTATTGGAGGVAPPVSTTTSTDCSAAAIGSPACRDPLSADCEKAQARCQGTQP